MKQNIEEAKQVLADLIAELDQLVEDINDATQIDLFFLRRIKNIINTKRS